MSQVILVNEEDVAIGTMDKMQAHVEGLLHRAFSVFIFDSKGNMLLQQRAIGKYHSGGLWTNACCSHPLPGEDTTAAAHRRLQEEMGFDTVLKHAFTFTYRSAFENGLTEYEVDHVYTGTYEGNIAPDPDEVGKYAFYAMESLGKSIEHEPHLYTSWFKIAFPKLETYLAATGVSQ